MSVLAEDLEFILSKTSDFWNQQKGQRIFLTGGTGFFGKWLLTSFIYINDKLKLNSTLIILSRDPEFFLKSNPQFIHLDHVEFIKGDIRDFDYPDGKIDFIIHAATEASVQLNVNNPLLMYDVIVTGTRRVLQLADEKKVKKLLFTSSGAVYGQQPSEITHLDESFDGCPNLFNANAAYGEGKRVAEMMVSIYQRKFGVKSIIARCFTFLGPYLPLDGSYAAGNFINNILKNEDIVVNGDGTPYRSYLYSSDLCIWMWTLLFKGESGDVYNVGSDEEVSISDLANFIASYNNAKVIISEKADPTRPQMRYVPSVSKIKRRLGLTVNISLSEAIKRTVEYHKFSVENF